MTFGELGLFVIIAYASGQLVQGVGNWMEWLWWKLWGGNPSRRVLAGHLISVSQHKRVVEALQKDGNVTGDVTTCSLPECFAIVREVYSVVASAGKAGRVDIFNGNYGPARGLAASLLALLITAIALFKGLYVIAALLVLLLLALQRMHRFGKHYRLQALSPHCPCPLASPEGKSSADRGHSHRSGRIPEGIGRPRTSNPNSVAHVI